MLTDLGAQVFSGVGGPVEPPAVPAKAAFTGWQKPGHPTCSTHEIAAASNIDERTVRYHADKNGKYGEPVQAGTHIYLCAQLPASLRGDIEALREEHALGTEAVVNCTIYQYLPQDYSANELALARQKANFVLAVYRSLDAHGGTKPAAVRRVVEWAIKQHPVAFTNDGGDPTTCAGILLTTAGHNGHSALSLDGACFPAYENFRKWDAAWSKYRRHARDDFQFWVLAKRRRLAGVAQRANYQRPGDPRFWTEFAKWYETPKNISYEESYREACGAAKREHWECPSLFTVREWYTERMPANERRRVFRARNGKKAWYDKVSVYVVRNWRKVTPDLCWSFDNHLMNVFCRRWDEERKGWVKVRPWLCNAVDASSWFEVGKHFTADPSRDSVEYAFRDALVRYRRAPKIAYFDNGKDFKSLGMGLGFDAERVGEIVGGLNIQAMFALPYNPRAKINERDYLIGQHWFEKKQLTYCGDNHAMARALRPLLFGPGGPCEEDNGRLLHPELVPTIDELAAAYAHWRETDRHTRVSHGKILDGKTPAQKYLAASAGQTITDDQIALAFLRTVGRQILRQPRVTYRPPNARAREELIFEDEVLYEHLGAEVTIKFDATTLRAFVFDADGLMIKCSGPSGSVPAGIELDALTASHEQIRARTRKLRSWERGARKGDDMRRMREAVEATSEQVARERGITPGQARILVMQTDDQLAAAAAEKPAPRKAALKDIPGTADDDAAWLRGETPETTKLETVKNAP